MKLNGKITYIFMITSILLYFSSFDEVYGEHKIGGDIIYRDYYELKIKSSPPGLQIDGSGIYDKDTWVITGAAQQKWGAYEFVGWKIDGNWADGNPITILMDKDHTVVGMYSIHPIKKQDSVNFIESNNKNTFDLFIISPYGKTTGSGSYSDNQVVDFSVSEQYVYDEIHDGVRYAFSGWSDGNTPNLMSNFIKINGEPTTIIAKWLKQYRLEIFDSTQNENIISTSWHNENSTAPLVMDNFELESDGKIKRTINEWVSTGSNFAVIKDSKKSITSVVIDNPYTISMEWKNQFYLDVKSKYGNVAGNGFYDEGDVVVASIDSDIQNSGITGTRLIFNGWNGDANSDGINVQVIMNKPKSIEGMWKKQFQLSVISEHGTPKGSGWYNEGSFATFGTNIPREPIGLIPKNTFQGWSGDVETQSNTGSILMNGPKTVTAKWNVDYLMVFVNIGLISGAVIGGLIIYKKIKNGSKQEKSLEKEADQSILKKTNELGTKINSKINFSNDQETTQNNKVEQNLEYIEQQKEKISLQKEQLEKNIAEVKLQKNNLFEKTEQLEKEVANVKLEKKRIEDKLRNDLTEMEYEKRKTRIELENSLAVTKLQKSNLDQKTEHLEKSITEVEIEKRDIYQKKDQLEKNIEEVEHQKRKSAIEFERRTHAVELERKELEIEFERKSGEVELQKNSLSQKTEQLEKNIAAIEIEKKNTFQEKDQLEKRIAEIEDQKEKMLVEFERKEISFKLERETTSQKTNELKYKISKAEFGKKQAEVELQKNISAIEIAKKRVTKKIEQLEKSVAEVELEKRDTFQKKDQLEKCIAEIEDQKNNLAQKTEQLEKNLYEIENQKEKYAIEIKKNLTAVELQKKGTSQRRIDLEIRITETEDQKKDLSVKTEQLEKSIAAIELEKKRIVVELENELAKIELEKKKTRNKIENDLAEIELQKNSLAQKIEQLEKSIEEVELEKKNASQVKEQLEKSVSEIERQKRKIEVEFERKESVVELEEKRIRKKAWDLEKRIGKFTLEMNISAIKIEKNRIAAELERKELTVDLEKEYLTLRKKELEKSIAAIEIEKDVAPTENEIQKNIKFDKNSPPKLKELKNIIDEIELARKISTVELERKESIIELEKKNLEAETEMLQKRMFGIETERKISSVQLEKIEAEIELEKKNLEQRTRDFGKNTASRNIDEMKENWNYSYAILDSEHNYDKKFRQWASILENELAIKDTTEKENGQDNYTTDGK